jgi:formylglycine-generating enzyme required for sulfatase activity
MVLVLAAAALTLAVSVGRADVFNMGGTRNPTTGVWTGEASLSFVTVGNPANAADPATGSLYGAVGYAYRMGTYDTTVGQYVQFLNAVAKTDTYGLYNSDMATDFPTLGISRSGSSGSYTYAVSGSDGQAANCPVFSVSWGDAARFCNWLQNGQPTGSEGVGTTETGAYTLDGDTSSGLETRNAGATYFIPSENEWYKAAYYDPANATYWTYETESNTAPSNVLFASGANNANYYDPGDGYTDPTNCLTPVGAFAASPGPYGTYDMGGDIWQWNEAIIDGEFRGFRGGCCDLGAVYLPSSVRDIGFSPPLGSGNYGFRVAATIPEPGDANGDGTVDVNDLAIVLSHFGDSGCTWPQGCMDGDPTGTVDINDLTLVLANFGYGVSAGAGLKAVPEPSAVLLFGLGAVSLVAHGWRRRRTLMSISLRIPAKSLRDLGPPSTLRNRG